MREPAYATADTVARFRKPSLSAFLIYALAIAFLVSAFHQTEISVAEFAKGIPNMGRLLGEMMPPSFERIGTVASVLVLTLQMAVAGAAIGIVLSFFVSIPASKRQATGPLYYAARAMIAFFRTVPDLVWAVFFVATVGLGPFAGVLTIIVDTIGFCGRFFAEAMEEVDRGPEEALIASGAGRFAVVLAAVVPAALPAFVNASLFALEKAVRASVILGLVGAGGIGIELKAAMDLFRFDEAATIILGIFLLVLAVEQLSAYVRRRIL